MPTSHTPRRGTKGAEIEAAAILRHAQSDIGRAATLIKCEREGYILRGRLRSAADTVSAAAHELDYRTGLKR